MFWHPSYTSSIYPADISPQLPVNWCNTCELEWLDSRWFGIIRWVVDRIPSCAVRNARLIDEVSVRLTSVGFCFPIGAYEVGYLSEKQLFPNKSKLQKQICLFAQSNDCPFSDTMKYNQPFLFAFFLPWYNNSGDCSTHLLKKQLCWCITKIGALIDFCRHKEK